MTLRFPFPKPKPMSAAAAALALAIPLQAVASQPEISGRYLEVRSCDVYTGPCFANAEMGLDGKEAIMVWTVTEGAWKGTDLSGLSVIAVVRTDDTLGDLKYVEPKGDTVLILDANANALQQAALASFARVTASKLIGKVVDMKVAPIQSTIGNCTKQGICAEVVAGDLVTISTRCLCDGDHICGNESLYYPPLTKIEDATAAFTETFSYQGEALDMKWATTGLRSAYVGGFAL